MPGNLIQPYVEPPLPMWRPDSWSLRDYHVTPPRSIPPNPPNPIVPTGGDEIAFGELPREMSAYQERPTGFFPFGKTVSSAPPPQSTQPQWQSYEPWKNRDYDAHQEWLAPILFPKPPPPFPAINVEPQARVFVPWTLRDYAPNQCIMASLIPVLSRFVPAGEEIAFGELPRDFKIYQFPLIPKQYIAGQNISLVVPPAKQFVFGYTARDMTALRIAGAPGSNAFAGIPIVPLYESYTLIEEDQRDMAPFIKALTVQSLPPTVVPYLYPTPPPPILPPPWNFSQYPSYQDQFSALIATVPPFPVSLQPLFTPEALIREIPRPQLLPQTFIIPPKPPRVVPTPATYVEWKDWALRDYDAQQSMLAGWLSGVPLPAGFRVMAVTAGMYLGVYYYPGDVFDLVTALDYSDSRKNYQINANEYAAGWMQQVAPATPLYQSIPNQPIPTFPVVDPNRRWGAM